MAGSRREMNKLKCRRQILKASRRLFKEKGYEATMIGDVAAKAEISKATLYNYFPSKESLLAGTLEEEIDAARRLVEEMPKTADADEKIRRTLTFLIADSIPFIGISRRILFLNACDGSPMYGKADAVKALFLSLAEEAKAEGIFRADVTAEEVVDLLIGLYLNSQFQWNDIERLADAQCAGRVERMLDLALAGCYATEEDDKRRLKGNG